MMSARTVALVEACVVILVRVVCGRPVSLSGVRLSGGQGAVWFRLVFDSI